MTVHNFISEKEQATLKLFREKLSDQIKKADQYEEMDLLRWLRARDLNVEKAEEMFRKSMSWREANNIDELCNDSYLDEYLIQKMPIRFSSDKQGTTVCICRFGRWDVKGLVEEGYRDRMFLYIFKYIELYVRHADTTRIDPNKLTQVCLMLDFDMFSMKQALSQQVISWVMEFLRLFDANYPERLKAAHIVNAPKIFELFWPLISPFLSARTLSKVQILGGSRDQWRSKLKESIDFHQLPSDLGGTNTTQNFYSNKLGVSILSLPRAPQYPSEDFVTVDVPAGRRFLLNFSLSAGNRITWNFKTDLHDIGFEFTKNGVTMFPYAKTDAHIYVQDGLVDVIEDGSYTLVFDNSYSRYRSKVLHYVACVDGKRVAS